MVSPEALVHPAHLVPTEPCGANSLEGSGSMASTLKVWVELATRLNATLVYNPITLCLGRNRIGHGLAQLLGLRQEPCNAHALWSTVQRRRWPVAHFVSYGVLDGAAQGTPQSTHSRLLSPGAAGGGGLDRQAGGCKQD